MATGVFGLKADGVANKDLLTNHPPAAVGEEIQARHFPAGSGDPIYVVAKAAAAEQVKTVLSGGPGIADVATPVVKDGDAFILGTLKDAPNSQAAMDTVERARTAVHKIEGADARLGGNTAVTLDMQQSATHDSKVIMPVVLIVVFLILALLLR